MSKRQTAKYKIDRRLGVNLWGRQKSPITKKEYGPGLHGIRRKKPSDYGAQLIAKQRLKGHYGNIGEKQFRRLFQEAVRRRGDTSENLVGLLERRLDTLVYRMKFALTPFQARQLINHQHILVNGKRVDIPSYQVSEGDIIEVKQKSRQLLPILFSLSHKERDVPDYLEVDEGNVKGRLIRIPGLSEIPYPCIMEPNLVIEFYSK
jgi:small subunit ribosomal protein S4